MIDNMSINRIRAQSSLATVSLGKPVLLMIGPPTAAQRQHGFQPNMLNFRMHVYHKDKWWNVGGHIVDRHIEYWRNWAPPGEWNNLGLKPDTMAKVEQIMGEAVNMIGLAPMFVKAERDPEIFEELLGWTQEAHGRLNDGLDGRTE